MARSIVNVRRFNENMKPAIIQLLKIIITISLIYPVFVQAEEERAWPIITFTCDKAKNEVKIKNEVKWGKTGKNFPFLAEQGTYNPWDLVNIVDRGERRLVSEKQQLELKCKLAKGDYRFVVRPKIFNPNFYGKCGDRLSVMVTIYKNKSILIKNKDMEKFCRGNSPVIRGIKVLGANSKVKLYEIPRSRFY